MDSLVFAFSRWNDVGNEANNDCKLHLSLILKGNLQ